MWLQWEASLEGHFDHRNSKLKPQNDHKNCIGLHGVVEHSEFKHHERNHKKNTIIFTKNTGKHRNQAQHKQLEAQTT